MLDADDGMRLGRLCSSAADAVHAAPTYPGIERIEARFAGEAYARHRHDTYAIGITMAGAQAFWYRGQERVSLPGQIIVLHPDEVHDGGAGTEQGLLYRMLYLDPALLLAGLGSPSASLPFVANPIVDDAVLREALMAALGDMEGQLEPLAADHVTAELADGLRRHSMALPKRTQALDIAALKRVQDYFDHSLLDLVRSAELEAISGLDRFTLTRQFKSLFGTSPHRYVIMRRVQQGRRMLAEGQAIVDVAAATGFADQSHFHRHFSKAFGMTPGRWQRLVRGAS